MVWGLVVWITKQQRNQQKEINKNPADCDFLFFEVTIFSLNWWLIGGFGPGGLDSD